MAYTWKPISFNFAGSRIFLPSKTKAGFDVLSYSHIIQLLTHIPFSHHQIA